MEREYWETLLKSLDDTPEEKWIEYVKKFDETHQSLEDKWIDEILDKTSEERALDYSGLFKDEVYIVTEKVFKFKDGEPVAMIEYYIDHERLVQIGIIVIDKFNNPLFIYELIKSLMLYLYNKHKTNFQCLLEVTDRNRIRKLESLRCFRNISTDKNKYALFLYRLDI